MALAGTLLAILRLKNELSPELRKAQRDLRDVAGQMTALGKGLTLGVTVPLVAAGAAAIKFGMDAVESENLVAVAFGNMRSAADDWSKGLSRSLGLNEFELRKQSATLFNMTSSMGIGRDAAFEMSTGIVELANDMASFRNIPFSEALDKIRAGLVGEAEPLKRLGILVDENTMKTQAYTSGIAKQGAELSQQQKVLARWQAILRQTSNDQGDLGRTLQSPANQLRILRARIEQTATTLGIALLPVVSQVIGAVAALVPWIQRGVEWFIQLPSPVRFGAVALAALAAAAGPVLLIFGSLTSTLATILPLFSTTATVTSLLSMSMLLLAKAVAVVAIAWASWKFGEWIGEITGLTNWLGENLAAALYGVTEAEYAATEAARQGAIVREQQATVALKKQVEEITRNAGALAEEAKRQAAAAIATAGKADADKAAAKAAREHATELKRLREQLTGEGTLQAIRDLHEAFKGVIPIESLTREQAKQLHETLKEGIEIYKARGQIAPAAWMAEAEAARAAAGIIKKEVAEAQAFVAKGFIIPKGVPLLLQTRDLVKQLGAVSLAPALKGKNLSTTLLGGLGETIRGQLGPTIMAALTGGGDVGKSVGGLIGGQIGTNLAKMAGKTLTGVFGKTIGGALGSVIPGLGTVLGSVAGELAGKLFGKLGSLFGKSQGRLLDEKATADIKKLSDDLAAAHGGMETLRAEAKLLGVDIEGVFGNKGRKGLENYKADVAAFEKQLASLKAAAPEINRLLGDIVAFGGAVPDQLQPVIDQLAAIGIVSADTMKLLSGEATVDVARMKKLAEEYGIELSALGGKFQAARISEGARKIITDFELLRGNGADVAGVLHGMRDEISQLVQDAKQFGIAIPENMRPWLEQLLAAGELVDADGRKLQDLSGIEFSQPIEVGVKAIVDLLKQLLIGLGIQLPAAFKTGVDVAIDQARRLADGVTGAIAQIPRRVDIEIASRGGIREHENGDVASGHAFGTHGRFLNFGGGQTVRLHGREAIVRENSPEGDLLRRGGRDDRLVDRLDDIHQQLAGQPRAMARAVRDALLMAR